MNRYSSTVCHAAPPKPWPMCHLRPTQSTFPRLPATIACPLVPQFVELGSHTSMRQRPPIRSISARCAGDHAFRFQLRDDLRGQICVMYAPPDRFTAQATSFGTEVWPRIAALAYRCSELDLRAGSASRRPGELWATFSIRHEFPSGVAA